MIEKNPCPQANVSDISINLLCLFKGLRLIFLPNVQATPSIPEIIWVKNVRAFVVCGFLMKSSKKHMLKI